MSETAIFTRRACIVDDGAVAISLHGMNGGEPSIAVKFAATNDICGLSAGFHMSTTETRDLAAQLVRHADITDAAQSQQVAA